MGRTDALAWLGGLAAIAAGFGGLIALVATYGQRGIDGDLGALCGGLVVLGLVALRRGR